jgi:hypothetical protein
MNRGPHAPVVALNGNVRDWLLFGCVNALRAIRFGSMRVRQILPWLGCSLSTPNTRGFPARGRELLEDMNVMVRLSSPYDSVLLAGSLAALRMSRSELASN